MVPKHIVIYIILLYVFGGGGVKKVCPGRQLCAANSGLHTGAYAVIGGPGYLEQL